MHEENLNGRQKRAVIRRTLKAVDEADRGYIARIVLAHLAELSSDFILIFLSALVIDGIAQEKPIRTLLVYAAFAVGIQVLLGLLQCFLRRREQSHNFADRMNLHRRLWHKAMTMDFVNLENADTKNRYVNASRQPDNINAGIAATCSSFRTIAGGIFLILTGAVLILPAALRESTQSAGFIQSPWSFAAVAAAVFALELFKSLVINPLGVKGFEKVWSDKAVTQASRAETHLTDHVLKNYRSGKEIRLYAQQDLIEKGLKRAQDTVLRGWMRGYRAAMLPGLFFQLVTILTKVLMYGFAVWRASCGLLSPGEVIAFAMYFEKISAGVASLSEGLGMLRLTPMFCKQYFDFLDIPDEKYKGSIPTEKRNDNEYEFEFRHVYFRYPNTDRDVLRDVNLKWRIGEKMALVGRNGSGKSTLVKLLCRLYDPTQGEITLNGVDIRKYDYNDYMALFSVVFQDSRLFSSSIAENVAAGTQYDAGRVEDCVRRSGLSERLDALPDGIETKLYKDFDENGVEISGGEAQKLCLARAIYKGAPFIVLDEPTAALDPVSEHEIYTKFNSIVGTRTAIYISHRLSSCRFCDEITVLDDGQIVERGTHDALVRAGGHYAALWNAQAEYYKDTASALFS